MIPRLGSAQIVVAFSDAEGFTVHHGENGTLLASIKPEDCDGSEWTQLWQLIDGLVLHRHGFRFKD